MELPSPTISRPPTPHFKFVDTASVIKFLQYLNDCSSQVAVKAPASRQDPHSAPSAIPDEDTKEVTVSPAPTSPTSPVSLEASFSSTLVRLRPTNDVPWQQCETFDHVQERLKSLPPEVLSEYKYTRELRTFDTLKAICHSPASAEEKNAARQELMIINQCRASDLSLMLRFPRYIGERRICWILEEKKDTISVKLDNGKALDFSKADFEPLAWMLDMFRLGHKLGNVPNLELDSPKLRTEEMIDSSEFFVGGIAAADDYNERFRTPPCYFVRFWAEDFDTAEWVAQYDMQNNDEICNFWKHMRTTSKDNLHCPEYQIGAAKSTALRRSVLPRKLAGTNAPNVFTISGSADKPRRMNESLFKGKSSKRMIKFLRKKSLSRNLCIRKAVNAICEWAVPVIEGIRLETMSENTLKMLHYLDQYLSKRYGARATVLHHEIFVAGNNPTLATLLDQHEKTLKAGFGKSLLLYKKLRGMGHCVGFINGKECYTDDNLRICYDLNEQITELTIATIKPPLQPVRQERKKRKNEFEVLKETFEKNQDRNEKEEEGCPEGQFNKEKHDCY